MIQSSQNRDTGALQIKLDELIRTHPAHHALLSLEQLDEDDLERIRKHYVVLAKVPARRSTRSKRTRATCTTTARGRMPTPALATDGTFSPDQTVSGLRSRGRRLTRNSI